MSEIVIETFVAGQLENNMYIVADKATNKAVLIDAPEDIAQIPGRYNVEYILLTHGHFDHIMGLNSLKARLNVPAAINENDIVISDNVNEFTRLFGLPDSTPPVYEKLINDGDVIKVGNMEIKVIHTPGHTQGGVCYLIGGNLFSGDTLFKESVGRTDLFGGSHEMLVESIKGKLFKLPDDINVYPGHGEMTTIGHEKKYNMLI